MNITAAANTAATTDKARASRRFALANESMNAAKPVAEPKKLQATRIGQVSVPGIVCANRTIETSRLATRYQPTSMLSDISHMDFCPRPSRAFPTIISRSGRSASTFLAPARGIHPPSGWNCARSSFHPGVWRWYGQTVSVAPALSAAQQLKKRRRNRKQYRREKKDYASDPHRPNGRGRCLKIKSMPMQHYEYYKRRKHSRDTSKGDTNYRTSPNSPW